MAYPYFINGKFLRFCLLTIFVAFQGITAQAQSTGSCDLFALNSPAPQSRSFFGFRASVSERFAIVGAGINSPDSVKGKAFIYEHVRGTWVYRQTLSAPGTVAADEYGSHVFIDENTALVAAENYRKPRNSNTYVGAIYVYTRQGSQWIQTGFIPNPSPTIAGFGSALAKSGTDVAVGCTYSGTQNGAVYVLKQPPVPTQPWTLTATLTCNGGNIGYDFGAALSIEGDNLLVGAHNAFNWNGTQPAVYFYRRTATGGWSLAQVESYPPNTLAGDGVAIYGKYAIVCGDAGTLTTTFNVHVYELTTTGWQLKQTLLNPDDPSYGYGYGSAVALNAGGLLLTTSLSGGFKKDKAVYRYELRNGSWQLRRRYYATPSLVNDSFGYWLAIDAHSNNFIVGASYRVSQGIPNAGQAFVQWSPAISPAGPYCSDASAIVLQATTTGGTWTGPGITNAQVGSFDPARAGPGTHQIAYSLSAGGCTYSDTVAIVVNPRLRVTRPNLPVLSCARDTTLVLTASPAGGSWRGPGIVNSTTGSFNTATAGPGRHVLTYSLAAASPCGGQDTLSIVVRPTVVRVLSAPAALCRLDTTLQLAATPPGGTWRGTGITNAPRGLFSAATAGPGRHVVRYELGSGACRSADSVAVVISPAPVPVLSPTGPLTLRCGQPAPPLSVVGNSPAGTRYEWQYRPRPNAPWQVLATGNGQPTYPVTEAGEYRVRVTQGSCAALSAAVELRVEPTQTTALPNVFTPNGDGLNDAFELKLQYPRTYFVQVFNRWGREVFSTNRYGDFWTGATNPAGAYYYLWRYSTDCEPTERVTKGWVELVR